MGQSLRRKIAIATWSSPREGNIYGKLTVNADQILAYVEHLRATSGEKVTLTSLVGKAAALALRKVPSLNGYLRFGRYVPHDTVDISFLVSLQGGRNLAKAKLRRVDEKPVVAIARELRGAAKRLATGRDDAFNRSTAPLARLPSWAIRPLLQLSGYVTGALGLSVPALGLEAFPFGACIITNVGVFGLDEGFVPPVPFARVPVYLLIGALRDAARVVDGEVVVQKRLTLTATVDHRFIDGAQAGDLARVLRRVLENPWSLDGLDGPPAAASVASRGAAQAGS